MKTRYYIFLINLGCLMKESFTSYEKALKFGNETGHEFEIHNL